MIRKISVGCFALILASPAAAQIYECVDAKGGREFAQSCAPGTVKQTQLQKSGAGGSTSPTPAAAPAKSIAERETEFKKRSLERQEAEAKAAKDQADSKDAQRYCNEARARIKQLQDGTRISRTDHVTGERSFLEDKDRPAEMADAQKQLESWCNKK